VRIISKAAISEFTARRPEAVEPLMHWYRVAKRAAWKNIAEVRQEFPHADTADDFTVFNIAGNKYRLITVIRYRWQLIYIRAILTHAEYSRGRWN
jgi:mRNA interferase HigB